MSTFASLRGSRPGKSDSLFESVVIVDIFKELVFFSFF